MKYLIVLASLGLPAAANAQLVVYAPASVVQEISTVANTAQTVANGYTMINGMIHGNGFAGLMPGLRGGLTTNPMSGVNTTAMMSGSTSGLGGLSGMFGQFSGMAMPYRPSGNDPQAQLMIQRAQAAAGQMSVGQQFMLSSNSRLSMLPQLGSSLSSTADIKASVDAGNRFSQEQTTQQAQGQQLQAAQLYQQAQANAERSRVELAYRQSADTFSTSAQGAASSAESGSVNLTSGSNASYNATVNNIWQYQADQAETASISQASGQTYGPNQSLNEQFGGPSPLTGQ